VPVGRYTKNATDQRFEFNCANNYIVFEMTVFEDIHNSKLEESSKN